MTYLAANIKKNIPENIREEYPLFVSFIQEYYNYLETIDIDLFSIKDIDLVDDRFIEFYRRDFAAGLPNLDSINIREFLRHAKEFYASRGSPESFAYLYRIIFNEEIQFEYPGDSMLRASAGIWDQEYFIEIETQYGTFDPDLPIVYEIKLDNLKYTLVPVRYEQVGNILRLYIGANTRYAATGVITQTVDDIILYSGNHVPCVSGIEIVSGGADWKIGSLIVIPGSDRDTYARVTKVNGSGAITKLETISFGMYHVQGQLYTVSPYKYIPIGTAVEYSVTGGGPFNHSLIIQDVIYDINETVNAVVDLDTFAEGGFPSVGPPYAIRGYFGETSLLAEDISDSDVITDFDQEGGISLGQWLTSRVTVRLLYALSSKNRGTWKNDDGQVSHDSYRLQDNFYYQVFSYIIASKVNSPLQDRMIKLAHPAGMKYFKKLDLRTDIDFAAEITRILSKETIYLFDEILVESSINKLIAKTLDDSISAVDVITGKIVDKQLLGDTQTIIDGTTNTIINHYYVEETDEPDYWDFAYTTNDVTLEIT
jgi:hypothetical protein